MGRKVLVLTSLAIVILLLVLVLAAACNSEPNWEQEQLTTEKLRAQVRMEQERREALEPWVRVFYIALGVVIILSLAGLSAVIIVALYNRWAATVPPTATGLYPLLRARLGLRGPVVIHDPNRQPIATTIYGKDGPTFPQLPGQAQATAQAQLVQATAARYREHQTIVNEYYQLHGQQPEPKRLSAPLPEPEISTLEPSHVERLLLEEGQEVIDE